MVIKYKLGMAVKTVFETIYITFSTYMVYTKTAITISKFKALFVVFTLEKIGTYLKL